MSQLKAKRLKNSSAYHHGDLKAVLLKTAIRILKKKSPEELSLRELAREAGVSQAAPYRHFKRKEDLIAALATEGFELKAKYMKQAIRDSGGDLRETYFACALSYFIMGKRHPQHFRLMFGSDIIPDQNHPDYLKAANTSFALLKDTIAKCQAVGIVGPGDPYHKALNCWILVHGFTSLYVERRLGWLGVSEENAEAALKTLLSQFHIGNDKSLKDSDFGFSVFQTKDSKFYRDFMENLAVSI